MNWVFHSTILIKKQDISRGFRVKRPFAAAIGQINVFSTREVRFTNAKLDRASLNPVNTHLYLPTL